MIKKIIVSENIIKESYPPHFNLEKFKTLLHSGQLKYARQNLTSLSQGGTSRQVFEIDNEKVLKVALSEKGRAQNELESAWALHRWHGDIVTEVFNFDDEDYNWVEAERAIPLKSVSALKKIFGGIDLYKLQKFLENNRPELTEKEQEFLENSELVHELSVMVGNFDMPLGDIMRPSSWGLVTRDGEQMPVLLDYGLNRKTHEKYYQKYGR